MRSVFFIYISFVLILIASAVPVVAVAQGQDIPEVESTGFSGDSIWKPSPRKAAIFSATLPGLGQFYNKKYWKVPVVYTGFAVSGYFIWFNASRYDTYKNAYLDFTDVDPETASYLELVGPGLDPATFDNILYPESPTYKESNRTWFKDQLKRGMDEYHRYRDLSIIGTAGWYLITVLDAVVDAQLFDYDISEDLAIHLLPVARPVGGRGIIGMTCSVHF